MEQDKKDSELPQTEVLGLPPPPVVHTLPAVPVASGYDIENSIFTFSFCLENLISVVNKSALFLASSVGVPKWYNHDFNSFKKLYDETVKKGTTEEDLKPSFRKYYLDNKSLFEDFDEEFYSYKALAVGSDDPPLDDASSSIEATVEFSNDAKLPVSSLIANINAKFHNLTSGKKKVFLKFHPVQFLFYFVFCIYNSLQDEDGGDELWEHLLKMSSKLDEVFEGKGPSSTGTVASALTLSTSRPLTSGDNGGSSLPFDSSQIGGILSMLSSTFGFNLNGSDEAINSFGKIFSEVSSKINLTPPAAGSGASGNPLDSLNITEVCNNVSEILANPEIQSEFNNIITNGKKLVDANSEVIQNPMFQDNIKNIAETFLKRN